MTRLSQLEQTVKKLYEQKLDSRADWADWLYLNHVVVVTQYARETAERVGADIELSQCAALLHDIADYTMKRNDPQHANKSLFIARTVLTECGYSPDEISIVVDDAIRYHSCHDGHVPQSQEGLVLATADSLAHLQSDFYIFAAWALAKEMSLEEVKAWTLKKLERDYNDKIAFDDIRREVHTDYELLVTLFSR